GPTDCNDSNGTVWERPGEVLDLVFSGDKRTLSWTAPSALGGASVLYDTLSSLDPANFVTAGACTESNGADLQSIDPSVPPIGRALYYLIRAQNACPAPLGTGSLGTNSQGTERSGRDCP